MFSTVWLFVRHKFWPLVYVAVNLYHLGSSLFALHKHEKFPSPFGIETDLRNSYFLVVVWLQKFCVNLIKRSILHTTLFNLDLIHTIHTLQSLSYVSWLSSHFCGVIVDILYFLTLIISSSISIWKFGNNWTFSFNNFIWKPSCSGMKIEKNSIFQKCNFSNTFIEICVQLK